MICFIKTCNRPDRDVLDALGIVPGFLSEEDPRPAAQQIHEAYQHGGGWDPLPGWKYDPNNSSIKYPEDDDPLRPLAVAMLHGRERIYAYRDAWFAIVQADDSCEVARLD